MKPKIIWKILCSYKRFMLDSDRYSKPWDLWALLLMGPMYRIAHILCKIGTRFNWLSIMNISMGIYLIHEAYFDKYKAYFNPYDDYLEYLESLTQR